MSFELTAKSFTKGLVASKSNLVYEGEHMKIISIDPGGVTGLVKHTLYEKEVVEAVVQSDKLGGLFTKEALLTPDHHMELWKELVGYDPDVIVLEDFIYMLRSVDKKGQTYSRKIELISRDYIGITKLYTQMREAKGDPVRLVMRQPGQGFKIWNDTKLKTLGLHTKGQKKTNGAPDINAAMRHLLDFLVSTLGKTYYITALKPRRS